MTPPPMQPMTEQVEELQQGNDLPLAVGPEERARESETTHEGARPLRKRQLPARFRDEIFEYNSSKET